MYTEPTAIVRTIEPAKDTLPMEKVVKLFSTAFEHICSLQEVDKLSGRTVWAIRKQIKSFGSTPAIISRMG